MTSRERKGSLPSSWREYNTECGQNVYSVAETPVQLRTGLI
jgi:hypothetical protein